MSKTAAAKAHAKNGGIVAAIVLGAFGVMESRNNRLAAEAARSETGKQDTALMLQLDRDVKRLDEIASNGAKALGGMAKQIDFLEKAILATLARPRGERASSFGRGRHASFPNDPLAEIVGEDAPAEVELPQMKTRGNVAKRPEDLVKQMETSGYDLE